MDIFSVLLHQHSRSIGLFIPNVVLSENHTDVLEITEHPVERPTSTGDGSSGVGVVADHAYRRPSEVVMEVGFSSGGSLLDAGFLDTSSLGISIELSPKEVYKKLLELQRSRQPFDVVTGKRQYKNMLIRILDVTTDRTSENVLMAKLTLREVIITPTRSITVEGKNNMTQGVGTSSVLNTGVKSPVPEKNNLAIQSNNWVGGR